MATGPIGGAEDTRSPKHPITMASAEIVGIGAIALTIVTATYKLLEKYIDRTGSSSDRRTLLDIVQRNAVALEKFAGSTVMLQRAIEKNTQATEKMDSTLTQLLLRQQR